MVDAGNEPCGLHTGMSTTTRSSHQWRRSVAKAIVDLPAALTPTTFTSAAGCALPSSAGAAFSLSCGFFLVPFGIGASPTWSLDISCKEMATIRIPTPLRPYSGGAGVVTVDGQTVGEALDALTQQHPQLRNHLFDGDQLRSFVTSHRCPVQG